MKASTPAAMRLLALKAFVARLKADDKPIMVGPWRSEVGFEVLYFIPFLNWLVTKGGIDPARLVIVTRGGAAAWYPRTPYKGTDGAPDFTVAPRSVELFTPTSIDEIRLENLKDYQATKLQKQTRCTAWDRKVLADAAFAQSVPKYHVLHPSWMYWAFAPFWDEQCGLHHVAPLMDFRPIPPPQLPPDLTGLPGTYVAVRFYERHTFPDHPQTRDMISKLVARLAAQTPVLVLNQPHVHADDHHDLPIAGPNVYLAPQFPLEQNLALTSALIARSQAFVGTYGGFAQLALRLGKPSLSFYTQFSGTAQAHLNLSKTVAHLTNVPFVTLGLNDLALMKMAMREVVAVQPSVQQAPQETTA